MGMILSESYRQRLKELAGIKPVKNFSILKEVEDLYANSDKRVKFDMNIMKQAIEGGMEMGMVFQSNNEKYKMPISKMRVIQPVAMGYDKKGQLVIRGVHIKGQSEKKAIQTGVRSAEAKDEWRLFKASNIKSIFFTGRLFTQPALAGYNPNDSAMTRIVVSFNPAKAVEIQKSMQNIKRQEPVTPETQPVEPVQKTAKPAVAKTPQTPKVPKAPSKEKEDAKKLASKIDKLNKLL